MINLRQYIKPLIVIVPLLLLGSIGKWLASLDWSYGSPACAIPILGSWLVIFIIWAVVMINISNMEGEK